jgi:phage baseplate assembly protein W|tara:strand:- start:9993 stop:10403 length:411 start_codon:yes stop_codon:yes gene_type:complete
MAFNSRKINPLDLQPRKAIGVSLPLSGKAVFNQTFQTKDAIRTNLINYFLTGQGERYLNPTFGTEIRNLMFENITQEMVSRVKSTVQRGLAEFFPSVQPTDFEVTGNPDTNTVSLLLRYAIQDTNIEDEVLINFEQ